MSPTDARERFMCACLFTIVGGGLLAFVGVISWQITYQISQHYGTAESPPLLWFLLPAVAYVIVVMGAMLLVGTDGDTNGGRLDTRMIILLIAAMLASAGLFVIGYKAALL